MEKLRNIMVPLLLCSLIIIFTGNGAFAQKQGKGMGIHHVGDWTTFKAKWLIGREVLSPMGRKLGKISDLVIDQENERIALVVVSGTPNLGKKQLPIPFSALTKTGGDGYRVGFRDRELTDLPATSDIYRVPSQIDPAWVTETYARYGQDAYWTEPGQNPLSSFGLYKAGKLLGADVRIPEGQKVAKASDLLIDSRNGHIVFVALTGVKGKGKALVPVPLNIISKPKFLAQ